MLRQATHTLIIETRAGLHEITAEVVRWVAAQGIREGLLTLLCRHTSASLLINENASAAVRRDLVAWLARVAPESEVYEHDEEGADDMPAHLRSVLTGVNLSIPLIGGRLALGTWQGVFLAEHRRRPHRREVAMHLLGE